MSLSIFLLLLVFFQPASVSTQVTAGTVTELEQRFTTALMKKDAVALHELLADDLLHIGFEGQFAGKAEYMAFFKRDIWHYRKYEPTNLRVKVLGNVAVVTGRVDRIIVISGKETTGAFAFTHVWLRTGDLWRQTSSQVTTIPNSTP
ncbi:MAG TPA: nuclear transport factor 2 family protein [Pyrinomonadaceae bacterium]|nr:nuclear transport factor 2 family protein [Pyrinomonadaceae bacterium]